MLSVSSRTSSSGARSCRARASVTCSPNPACQSWAAETLTATGRGSPRSAQALAWAQAWSSTQAPSGRIRPVDLGDRDELGRAHHAARRAAPAQQRLDAHDPARRHRGLRLVDEAQLVVLHGRPQVPLQLAPGVDHRVEPRLEEGEPAAARLLGAVERQVGVAQQLLGRGAVAGAAGDADAGRDPHLLVLEPERLDHRGHDPPRGRRHVARLARPLLEHRELVPAQPGDEVALADHAPDPPRHLPQQLVPGRVAVRVVHRLEPVEVEDQQRQTGRPVLAPRRRAWPAAPSAASGSAGR